MSRSNSLRKRDSSWDNKWVEQVRRNKEEEGAVIMKRETSPRKLNVGLSFWEKQVYRNRLGYMSDIRCYFYVATD